MCGRSLFGCVPTTRVVAEASSSVVLYVVSSTEQNFPSVPSSHRCPESGDLPARYAQTVEYLSSRWRTGLTAELSDNHHATIQYHLDHHDESSLAFGYAITETASGQAEGTVMVKAELGPRSRGCHCERSARRISQSGHYAYSAPSDESRPARTTHFKSNQN